MDGGDAMKYDRDSLMGNKVLDILITVILVEAAILMLFIIPISLLEMVGVL